MDDAFDSDSDSQESDYEVDSDAESVCSTTSSHALQTATPSLKVFVSYPSHVSREDIKDHLRICGLSDNVRRLNMFYDRSKRSKGCGYIEFVPPSAGRRAITTLKRSLLLGKHQMDAKKYTERVRKRSPRKAPMKSEMSAPLDDSGNKLCKVFVGAGVGRKLPDSIKSGHLKRHLSEFQSAIQEVVIATDPGTEQSKGYGFVFFKSRWFADAAIEKLTGTVLHGCPLSLELSTPREGHATRESPAPEESGGTKVFVGALVESKLPSSIQSVHLQTHFWEFEHTLQEAVVVTDPVTNQSKGYGFAIFKTKRAAEAAIKKLAGSVLHGCQLKLEIAKTKEDYAAQRRTSQSSVEADQSQRKYESATIPPGDSGRRVYVGAESGGKLPSSIESAHLESHFWQFKQTLEEVFIVKDTATKQSKGFGFAGFRSKRAAETAIRKLGGSSLHGCQLKLELAKPKGGIESVAHRNGSQSSVGAVVSSPQPLTPKDPLPSTAFKKGTEVKVFVGGLRHSVETTDIQKHFSAFASDIVNIYMYIPGDNSPKRCAFVVVSSYEAAERVISTLNGTKLHGSKIRVQHDKHTSKPPSPPTPAVPNIPSPPTAGVPNIMDCGVPLQPQPPLIPLGSQPSSTVLLSNLSPEIDGDTVRTLCKGKVIDLRLVPVDVTSKKAVITFACVSDAQTAICDLNGRLLLGQEVRASFQQGLSPEHPETEVRVGNLIDPLSIAPDIQELIQLSSAQCNLLTAVNPAGSSLYQELVQPFKTNPNVKIELLLAEVAVRFTGQREAVQSAHSHFKSHLKRCVPIDQDFVQTLMEVRPDFSKQMMERYGVIVMGLHNKSTLLKLDGPGGVMAAVREVVDKLIVGFQRSLAQTQLPLTCHLLVSAKKRLKNEKIEVRLTFHSVSPQEVVVFSFSPDDHQKALKILSSKPAIRYVPFQAGPSLKQISFTDVEAKFSVYVAVAEAEEKIYIKGFVKQDVVSAYEQVVTQVSKCSVQFSPLACSPEQALYLAQKMKFQRETTLKFLNSLPAQVLAEPNRPLHFKGSPKDIAMSQKQLLEGPLLCGLQSQSFTFTAQDNFFLQLEKHVLRPMKKEHPGFEYIRSDLGGDPSPRKGRRGSARGEESEFTVTVLSQEPEVFEEAVATLEDVTPCVRTLSLAHSNAMDCVQKHIEEHEHKYRVRIVVPKDSNTRLLIFGLTEREASQCLNELRESVESTVEAEKYVKIDHNQVSYFKQKKSEEWEELRGMCMSFKVFDKQKQEKGTALIRVEGTVRQVKAVCQRLSAMRELGYFSRSFTVSIERRYNNMWLKFWQAVIKEREENLDLIVVVDSPAKLSSKKSSNEIEYEFSVCGGDENGTIEIEKEFTDPQTVQKSLPHSEVAVKELEKGIKEKKLGLDQYYVDVYIDTKGSQVILTAPAACKDDLEAVEGEIEQYVSHRTLADREIAVNDPVLALVLTSKSKSSPHLAFANQLSKPYGVSVQSLRHPQCGLRLRGSQDSLNQVEPLIRQKVIEAIQSTIGETKFPVSLSLLPFFETPDFVHFSAKIRDELYVLCTFPKARGENQVIKSAFLTTANPDCRIKLEICKGDMINEEVDTIVNAANEDLQHVGGLAKAIAQAGGSSIQMESDVHIKQHGKLRAGEVVCLGAGHLACKKVLHTVGPQWKDGRSGEEQTLYFAVLECLKLCQKEGLESVAFPAISTGIYMVPDRVCIQASLKAVRDFCQVTTKSCVTHIRFVLCHSDVAKRFALALDSDIMLGCIIPRTEVTSSPGAPQGHTWEWMADDGSFVPYQQDVSSLLSNKYSKDPGGQVLFSVGKHTYTVVLSKMSQVNLQTFRQRQIRRVPAALTPSSPTSIQWKFVNDHQRLTPYSPSDSQAIEAMHQSKVPGQLTVKGRTYTFDFTQMCQINTETSYKRPIQRSILNPPPEVGVPDLPVEKKEKKVIFTLRGPSANLTVAKKRLDEKLEGALANGDITFPSSLEKKVLSIVQQYKLDFNTKSVADQKGKKKRVTFNGLSSSVSKATSAIQEEIINYHAAAAEQSAVELPPEWEPQTQNLQLCTVVQGSPEWNRVVDNFQNTLPSVGVIGVTRIQNKWLWERYVQHKQRLSFKNSGRVNERELFHGTRANDPKLIYEGEDGFDMRYSSAGMWGLANYFAVNAGYSDPYAYQRSDGSKDIFMVKVLTGDSYQCSSNQKLRMPPEKQPEAQGGGLQFSRVRYDTVTGITRGSQVFMTYDNDKAYPAYLIQYN